MGTEEQEIKTEQKSELEQLKEQVESANALAKKNENRYLYLAADFDNFKKQQYKQRQDIIKYKNEDLLNDLLNIVDSFELAKIHETSAGFTNIYNQFVTLLESYDVKQMDCEVGQPYNDNMNCLSVQTTNVESLNNTVSAIIKKGYLYKDKVLRHPTVCVYKTTE